MRKAKGFSLIELLIVIAIILIIAAIAIPNLIRSKLAANEASAVASIRTITTAETTYSTTFPEVGYTCTLSELGPPAPGQPVSTTAGGILDTVLASGTKRGYFFSLSNCNSTPRATYSSVAVPLSVGATGTRSFCSDASGIIWQGNDGTAATCQSAGIVIQ
ncbi:MAG: prepilin-type N-terminal cleavage/methylation domain-containing protein [Terriglobales bacterium]